MAFAQNLVHLMELTGMTNYALAKKLDCHQSTVQNWIDGSIPQKRTQKKLAEKLGVTVDELMGDDLPTPGSGKPLFMDAEKSKGICRNLVSLYGSELMPLRGFLPSDVCQQIKKAEYVFTKDVAAQIAEHLNVSVDYLLTGNKKEPVLSDELSNTGYDDLNAENKKLVDSLIEKLLRSQSGD